MKKIINNTSIWIEGTWCEVIDENGDFLYYGNIEEGMTHEEIYRQIIG